MRFNFFYFYEGTRGRLVALVRVPGIGLPGDMFGKRKRRLNDAFNECSYIYSDLRRIQRRKPNIFVQNLTRVLYIIMRKTIAELKL